jgi:hypothetical protein
MIHHRRRVDENQKSIVSALKAIGACVLDLSSSGGGVMDLLVIHRGRVWMVEVKNPAKPKADQSLTPAQIRVHAEIGRAGGEVKIIRTVDEAIAMVTHHDQR